MRSVYLIAAEDTRRTRQLLTYYNLSTPLTSYHDHNRTHKAPYLLQLLQEDKDIALVSDAGLPGISDPGEKLVQQAISVGINVITIPGANAALTALVASGLPAGRFVFEGFLPRATKARRQKLISLAPEERTLIFYEAPHRLLASLKDMLAVFGARRIAIGRELTKKFESVWRGFLAEAIDYFEKNPPRGEFTLVIAGAEPLPQPQYDPVQAAAKVAAMEAEGIERKKAMAWVARHYGCSRRKIYQACLENLK